MSDELELPPISAEELPLWLADEVPFLLADEPPFWLVADVPFDEFPFVSELVTVSLESPSRSSLDGLLELSSQAISVKTSVAAAMVAMDPVTLRLQDDVENFCFIIFSFFSQPKYQLLLNPLLVYLRALVPRYVSFYNLVYNFWIFVKVSAVAD